MEEKQLAANELRGMDYTELVAEGVDYLKQLCGDSWTDFYPHDPGVTLLEYLCYAITDLCYRLNFPIADLMTTTENLQANSKFFTAREILTISPVTLADYRRLLIDVSDPIGNRLVKNAWIEPIKERDKPQGFYRVYLDEMDSLSLEQKASLIPEVKKQLAAQRNLCEDFQDIVLLKEQPVFLKIDAQITDGTDANELAAKIYHELEIFLSPTVQFCSLEALLNQGKAVEDIFNGPKLLHGFIEDAELNRCSPQKTIHVSNLVSLLQKLPRVETLRTLSIIGSSNIFLVSPDTTITEDLLEKKVVLQKSNEEINVYWLNAKNEQDSKILEVEPKELMSLLEFPQTAEQMVRLAGVEHEVLIDKVKSICGLPTNGFVLSESLTVDPGKSFRLGDWRIQLKYISFTSNKGTYPIDQQSVATYLNRLRQKPISPEKHLKQDIPIPVGRDRQLANYISIQQDLPAYYGVKATLPDSAGALKIAQARQLKAYLLIFDQILANHCAQLWQAKELLAVDSTRASSQTIFHQAVSGVSELDKLLRTSESKEAKDQQRELEHKNRLLDHLLARYYEEFAGDTLLLQKKLLSIHKDPSSTGKPDLALSIAYKTDLLKNYAQLSYTRGQAFNYQQAYNQSNRSTLEKRIASMMGTSDPFNTTAQDPVPFYLIEHHLLASAAKDNEESDFFSFRVSFVFPDKFQVEQDIIDEVIRSQIPAHIRYSFHWLNETQLEKFKENVQAWVAALNKDEIAALPATATTIRNWLQPQQSQ